MLGLGSLGILWVMGPGAGVGRKEQDKGCEGGEGSGGSRARGERPAALCSLALPTSSLSSASRGRSASGVFSAPRRGCSPHGANQVLPQPTHSVESLPDGPGCPRDAGGGSGGGISSLASLVPQLQEPWYGHAPSQRSQDGELLAGYFRGLGATLLFCGLMPWASSGPSRGEPGSLSLGGRWPE